MKRVRIDENLCILCGACEPICVRHIIALGEDSAQITDASLCIQCGHCRAVCPVDAPQLPFQDPTEFRPVPEKDDASHNGTVHESDSVQKKHKTIQEVPVEKKKLERILEAGRFAPTGGNMQPLHHIVVTTPETLNSIRDMTITLLAAQAELIEEAYRKHREEGVPLPAPFVGQGHITSRSGGRWRGSTGRGLTDFFIRLPALSSPI